MQIRCFSCSMPIAISKANIHAALDWMETEDMQHYDLRCPKCRKTNRVSKEALVHAAPDWESKQERSVEEDE